MKKDKESPPAVEGASEAEPIEGNGPLHYRLDDHTLRTLASQIDFKTAPAVLTSIRDLQGKYVKAMGRLQNLSEEHVRALVAEQDKAGIEGVMAGDPTRRGTGGQYRSRSQLRESVASERATLKTGIRHLAAEAAKLAVPEMEKFLSAGTAFVDSIEAAEKALSEKFKFPVRPVANRGPDSCLTRERAAAVSAGRHPHVSEATGVFALGRAVTPDGPFFQPAVSGSRHELLLQARQPERAGPDRRAAGATSPPAGRDCEVAGP